MNSMRTYVSLTNRDGNQDQLELLEHHGKLVAADPHLAMTHREHCLCHRCPLFKPDDREKNCEIANTLYHFDILAGVTTPVYHCQRLAEHLTSFERLQATEG